MGGWTIWIFFQPIPIIDDNLTFLYFKNMLTTSGLCNFEGKKMKMLEAKMDYLLFKSLIRFIVLNRDFFPPLWTLGEHILTVTLVLSSSELGKTTLIPVSTLCGSTQVQQLYVMKTTLFFFFFSVFIGGWPNKGAYHNTQCVKAVLKSTKEIWLFISSNFIICHTLCIPNKWLKRLLVIM